MATRAVRAAQRHIARMVVTVGLRDRMTLLCERQRRHTEVTDPEAMARWQVDAFNRIWSRATQRFRFYAAWKQRHRLPEQLRNIQELDQFPILQSADIEQDLTMIREDAAPCRMIFTGGSSGRSRLFPRGSEDYALLYASMYLGRSWAGIRPGDDIVQIWGHEHLFGHGAWGRLRKAQRHIKDWLIGTRRLNVYRLDDASVAAYFDIIRERPGTVIIGYVSAIRKLLDFIERSGVEGAEARVRAVIFCAEAVNATDLDRVRRLLEAIPLIEYGMQETGPMAYTHPDSSNLTFFWDAFHCHATAEQQLVVTTLQPQRFPLVNFGTEDRIEPLNDAPALPFRCARITGRTRDTLQLSLRNGQVIEAHSELIIDLLDVLPEVRSYFIHQRGVAIEISVDAAFGLDLDVISRRFIREISREFPAFDESTIAFTRLKNAPQTIAGKRQYILRE
jgi:phenylacetate-coenzyme A ligase PaaK-like adenylate-forming protein